MLEQHGYPPLLMGLESVDMLDHVIFVYRHRGRWGSVARSRDPGLHGRKPVFRSPRALAESYFDPYIDYTGCVTGYSVVHLRGDGIVRLAVFTPQRLGGREHAARSCRTARSSGRASACAGSGKKYRAYLAKHKKKPLYYRGREKWTEIPKEFL